MSAAIPAIPVAALMEGVVKQMRVTRDMAVLTMQSAGSRDAVFSSSDVLMAAYREINDLAVAVAGVLRDHGFVAQSQDLDTQRVLLCGDLNDIYTRVYSIPAPVRTAAGAVLRAAAA